MPDPTYTPAPDSADVAVDTSTAAVSAAIPAVESGVIAASLPGSSLDPLSDTPNEDVIDHRPITTVQPEIGPECIFLIGKHEGEEKEEDFLGLHPGTARAMLSLIDFDKVDAITIFNYRPEHTYKEYSLGLRRSIFRSARSMVPDILPEHEEDTEAVRLSQPWFYDLLDYLADRWVHFEKGLVGKIGVIHVIGHADFNGVYLKKSGATISLDLNPSTLPQRYMNHLLPIREQLHPDCHVKLWGCARYPLGAYMSSRREAKYANDIALFSGIEDAPEKFRSLLKGAIRRDGMKQFSSWFRKQIDAPELDGKGKVRVLKIIANNVFDVAFKLGPYPDKFNNATFPAIAIGKLLHCPVICSPWGVPSNKRKVSKSERIKNPSTPFKALRLRKWVARETGELTVLSPNASAANELSELSSLISTYVAREENPTLPSHIYVANAPNPSRGYIHYYPSMIDSAELPIPDRYQTSDQFPTFEEARAIVGDDAF
ncbi:MAG: hypothetical protein C0631_04985 [Sedimenticola sp.]|nr:MAG: hypothetical protein C0631_04985 [Sedimenticola sp.]